MQFPTKALGKAAEDSATVLKEEEMTEICGFCTRKDTSYKFDNGPNAMAQELNPRLIHTRLSYGCQFMS